MTIGQIESTTILTNNRALGIVNPQATMEFDLPKRDLMIVEVPAGNASANVSVRMIDYVPVDPRFVTAARIRPIFLSGHS